MAGSRARTRAEGQTAETGCKKRNVTDGVKIYGELASVIKRALQIVDR